MQETWVQSLGQEDILEKEMATHSSILAWKITWMEKPGRLQSMGHKESDTTEQLHYRELWASLVVQIVKNPPAMQETQVLYLDQENPLEKGMATHSSMLAWRIPWREEPGRLQSMGRKESDMTERL